MVVIYVKLLLTAFFWGGTFIAGRVVSRHIDPFISAFLRFFIATLFFAFLIKTVYGTFPKLKKDQIFPVVCLGLTGIFSYNLFFFKGLQSVTAGRAALIIALNPIAITLLSAFIFKEKITLLRFLGILMSVSGAIVVITRGDISELFRNALAMGDLYIFLCVISWVAYSLIGKFVLRELSPLVSVGYSSMVGMVALFFPALMNHLYPRAVLIGLTEWGALFYLGFFGTVLGFFWYYEGLNKIGPMKASVFINFVPICSIVLAYLILDEPVTLSLAAGACLVVGGVLLTNVSAIGR